MIFGDFKIKDWVCMIIVLSLVYIMVLTSSGIQVVQASNKSNKEEVENDSISGSKGPVIEELKSVIEEVVEKTNRKPFKKTLKSIRGTFYSPGIGCGTIGASGEKIISNKSIALNASYMRENGIKYGDYVRMKVTGGESELKEYFDGRVYRVDDTGCPYGVADIVLSRDDARRTGMMLHGVLQCDLEVYDNWAVQQAKNLWEGE